MNNKWIGPDRFIPDLGVTIEAGTVIALPADWISESEVVTVDDGKEVKTKVEIIRFGGEGTLWEKTKAAVTKKDQE